MNPFISIIIPTYNRAHLICKTLTSVLNQAYKNFEVIIVDDGSTDNTMEVVKEFIRKNNLKNFHYYFKENAERAAARNFGLTLAKGDYVNFVDSDDILLYNHLSEALLAINELSNPEVFHLNYAWVTPDLKITKEVKLKAQYANKKLISGNILSCNGVFIKKKIAYQYTFNDNRNLSASEDWELWLRLSARFKIHMLPTITSYIVNHEERSVNQFNELKITNRRDCLINSLAKDDVFTKKFPNGIKIISSHMNSYIALHAALNSKKFKSIKYFVISITQDFTTLFNKRSLAIFKHLLL
jgi:glycosyltransferase involved in cell wall biosynthesis